MSSSAKKITVNCGTTHVSVSVFSEKAGSLVLEKLVVEELVYDYTAEEERELAASSVLSSIFKSLKLKGPATVIAPGYLLLTKNVKVPQVEASRQRQIISFEAADKFPFPLQELVWESQIISTDGVEAEVVLFAIRRENATRFAAQMLRAGITPEVVQPSTNLDYQAYRYLNGDATENVLIVNVGARTTNLTFVTQDGFGIQNIAVGGNFLTQAIADSLGKPFLAAERLKVNYFSNAMDLAEDDPHVAMLKSNAQAFCRRLSQEITRRIVNQRRQNPNGAPTKILLTGRGALLPELPDALAESQRLPVEFFEPTVPVQVAPGVDTAYFDSVRFQLSEVIGDASSLLDTSSPQVNLLPRQIAAGIDFAKKKPALVAAAVFFAIAPWMLYFGLGKSVETFDKERASLVAEKKMLENRMAEIEKLAEDNVPVREFVEEIDGVIASRGNWENFLAEVQKCVSSLQMPASVDADTGEKTFLPDRHVWVDSLRVTRDVSVPATDSEDPDATVPAPRVETKATLTLRLLIPQVDGFAPTHNSAEFNRRRTAVLNAFEKSPLFEKVSSGLVDFAQNPNFPTITLNLVLKPEKGI